MSLIKVKSNFTQVPNTWLTDKNLSLKAKGLLAVMQSLPENWNFSVVGMSKIMKEGVDSIRTTVHELEASGYLTREQIRDSQGKITDTIWTLFESTNGEKPLTENSPMADSTQYNTNKQTSNQFSYANCGISRCLDSEHEADASCEPSARREQPFSSAVNKQEENLTRTAVDLSTRKTTKETFALVNELVELVGSPIKGKKTVLKKCVEARLSDGYSKSELRNVARWASTQSNPFYKSPYKLFSETGFNNALVEMKSEKPRMTTTRTI